VHLRGEGVQEKSNHQIKEGETEVTKEEEEEDGRKMKI